MTPLRRIWIDTDHALGAAAGDVDDGFAVAHVAALAKRGDVELLGISAVDGNTDAETAHRTVIRSMQALGLDVPVVASHDAAARLVELSGEKIDVLAIGPLTNIARALTLDVSWPHRVRLSAVTSVRDRLRSPLLPLFDLNRKRDPVAAQRVLQAPFRERRIFPLDVVAQLRFGSKELNALHSSNAFGAFLAEHAERWLRRAPVRYLSTTFPVWDLVAAMDATGSLPRPERSGESLVAFDIETAKRTFLEVIATSDHS